MAKTKMFENEGGIIKISTTVTKEDRDYCKRKQIMYSQLLRGAIRDHRVHANDPTAEPSIREMRDKIEKMVKKIEDLTNYMHARKNPKGDSILDEYLKIKGGL